MQAEAQAEPNVSLKQLDEEDIVRAGNTVCVICLRRFVLGEDAACLICKHVFHVECVQLWFETV